jgi:hypothetical protein
LSHFLCWLLAVLMNWADFLRDWPRQWIVPFTGLKLLWIEEIS